MLTTPTASVVGCKARFGGPLLFLGSVNAADLRYVDGFNMYYGALKPSPFERSRNKPVAQKGKCKTISPFIQSEAQAGLTGAGQVQVLDDLSYPAFKRLDKLRPAGRKP